MIDLENSQAKDRVQLIPLLHRNVQQQRAGCPSACALLLLAFVPVASQKVQFQEKAAGLQHLVACCPM